MLYHYSAADKTGKIIEAEIDADNLSQVLHFLSQKEMKPLSVKPIKTAKSSFFGLFGGITLTDKLFLTKYLSLMLKVGTDLLSAVNILISDFDKPAMRNFLFEVRENLSNGRPFYQAFANYPRTFSLVFVNLVKASEVSGNLQQTFEDLSNSMQREAELRSKVRSAFIYPIILTVMAFIIIAIGILEIFIGIGLWKRKSWARITAIILSIIGILAALVGMANKDILNNILGLVINGAIAVYLLFSYNVKKAFY